MISYLVLPVQDASLGDTQYFLRGSKIEPGGQNCVTNNRIENC